MYLRISKSYMSSEQVYLISVQKTGFHQGVIEVILFELLAQFLLQGSMAFLRREVRADADVCCFCRLQNKTKRTHNSIFPSIGLLNLHDIIQCVDACRRTLYFVPVSNLVFYQLMSVYAGMCCGNLLRVRKCFYVVFLWCVFIVNHVSEAHFLYGKITLNGVLFQPTSEA